MKNKLASLLISIGLVLGVSQALAVDITIADYNPGAGFGGGPFGAALEDNETEPGTVASQAWDMEAFVIKGSTLYIVGGYNMQAGEAGSGGSVVSGMLTPGDLFIKVGGTQPLFSPTANTGNVTNSIYSYSYAVDLTQNVGATGPSAQVFALNPGSVLKTAVYDQFGANPWKYDNGAQYNQGNQPFATSTLGYSSGLTTAQVNTMTYDVNILAGISPVGLSHNVLTVDLSFLGSIPLGTDVWFSYTMECGNDSLKGKYAGGFYRTPDSASSVLLIGLGLAAMGFFGLKSRR
jgi:hypothetical protein